MKTRCLELLLLTVAVGCHPGIGPSSPGNDGTAQAEEESERIPSAEAIGMVQTFRWSAATITPETVAGLQNKISEWQADSGLVGEYRLPNGTAWFKGINHQSPGISNDGHLVALRRSSDGNPHTMLIVRNRTSACHVNSGLYLRVNRRYRFIFEVMHPVSEAGWLSDHTWTLVMQLWGPRDRGDVPRNPPFAIYTRSEDGQPVWEVVSRADPREISVDKNYQDVRSVRIPMGPLGQWNHWQIDYVANPQGSGMVRAWLNNQLVADWPNIRTGFASRFEASPIGPTNPQFGLYGPLVQDPMQVQLRDIAVFCDPAAIAPR